MTPIRALVLFQFPISHYCEKIRWALDYKRLAYPDLRYTIKNLLPGFHVSTTRKWAKKTSVPILVHNNHAVQNSSDIITCLDNVFADNPLTPADADHKKQALQWEQYLDDELGVHVRRYCYHILLEHPAVVIKFFTHHGAWYGPILYRLIFSKFRQRMRQLLQINAETASDSRQRVENALDKVNEQYAQQPYLVGDAFTRADLTAASLMAPLCKPEKYGVNWPDKLPNELEQAIEGFSSKTQWLHRFYREFR